MLPRVLEPEAMDTPEEARDYDAMDHAEVNARFVADFVAVHGAGRGGLWLDVGTGPARIPIALARAAPTARMVATDLAWNMLDRAGRNVAEAGLSARIVPIRADAKRMPFADGAFEAVLSNTILHHLPDPTPALAEMVRLAAPGGTVFVRDLARPDEAEALRRLVTQYAGTEPPAAQQLFASSLHAALRRDEVAQILQRLGLSDEGMAMTSDRHWTWAWRRPE